MSYLTEHNACNLQIGNKVRVIGTVPLKTLNYLGWKNVWAPHMDNYLGQTYIIANDLKELGFVLNNGCNFPFFVLQKVET